MIPPKRWPIRNSGESRVPSTEGAGGVSPQHSVFSVLVAFLLAFVSGIWCMFLVDVATSWGG